MQTILNQNSKFQQFRLPLSITATFGRRVPRAQRWKFREKDARTKLHRIAFQAHNIDMVCSTKVKLLFLAGQLSYQIDEIVCRIRSALVWPQRPKKQVSRFQVRTRYIYDRCPFVFFSRILKHWNEKTNFNGGKI